MQENDFLLDIKPRKLCIGISFFIFGILAVLNISKLSRKKEESLMVRNAPTVVGVSDTNQIR